MTKSIDSQPKTPPEITDLQRRILEKQQETSKRPRLNKWRLFVAAGLLGASLISCQRLDAAFRYVDPAERDPTAHEAYEIWKNNKAKELYGDQDLSPQFEHHSPFEIPNSDQTIWPGSRVRVVETGDLGLNIRTEAGLDSELIATVPDDTVFKIIELLDEKDGYYWVLVKSEPKEGEKEIVGYAVTDWFQVLEDKPRY